MSATRAFLALTLMASVSRAAGLDHLPPSTSVVMSLESAKVFRHPLVQKHIIPEIEGILKQYPNVKLMLKLLKLDPYKDITQLTLSMGELLKGEVLATVSGNFNLTRIRTALAIAAVAKKKNLTIHKLKTGTIYEVKEAGLSAFASFLDKQTLIVSFSRSYLESILKAPKPKKSPVLVRLIQLAKQAKTPPVGWAVAIATKETRSWLMLTPLATGVSQIRAATGRIHLSKTAITATGEIHATTALAARALCQQVTLIRPILLLAKLNPIGREIIDDVLRTMKVSPLRKMARGYFQVRLSSIASLLRLIQPLLKLP